MKKFITAVVVVAAMTTPVAFANNQDFGGRHQAMSKFADKLGLTDAQKQQIKDLNKQFRQDNMAFLQQVRATRQEARAAKQAN
ncbi:MAG TPA: hypothetical protein VF381_01600, partial [Thermoanaerobaculia bacterium]